jgi:tRNA(fMet)-specific endonuclease VapC
MRKILLDTNAYVAFKNGNQDAIEIIRLAAEIGMSLVVLGELLAGFVAGGKEMKNRQELDKFLSSPRITIIPIDEETPEFYARIFKQLKVDGQLIPINDLWIAASALQHGYAVLTYDKHFYAVKNLITCRTPAEIVP